jgi:hypothetical protein
MNKAEQLDAQAHKLKVSVKSLKQCLHPESLIYFDKVYGLQSSWEVCDHCGQEHSFQILEKGMGVYPGTLEGTR